MNTRVTWHRTAPHLTELTADTDTDTADISNGIIKTLTRATRSPALTGRDRDMDTPRRHRPPPLPSAQPSQVDLNNHIKIDVQAPRQQPKRVKHMCTSTSTCIARGIHVGARATKQRIWPAPHTFHEPGG